jgi:GNAT superfamily N-acetyltransferase
LVLYHEAFPSNERHADEIIIERVKSGSSKLFVAKSDIQFCGFALMHDLKEMPFVLLDYLAVKQGIRKEGIGSALLKFVADYYIKEGKSLIIESENPDYGENQKERENRMNFYLKNGGNIIPDINYLLPPLDGTVHTEMKLILFNQKPEKISINDLKNLITIIYKQIYRRGTDDKYLISILNSII